MKIYFCGSIRGGRDHQAIYHKLIKHIQGYGEVLTEHVGSEFTDPTTGKVVTDTDLDDIQIHNRDISWLRESDVIVAEVTMPSLGVGYELGFAKLLGKPTLCLFRELEGKHLSAMVAGAEEAEKFVVQKYRELDEATKVISGFLKEFQ